MIHSEFRIAIIAALLLFWTARAAALPDGVQAERWIDGLQFPVAMSPTPNDEILVTEKMGTLRLIRDGSLLEEPIATFDVLVKDETGLLGVEIMPDYADTGEFVVTYTPSSDPASIYLSRLRLDAEQAVVLDDPWLTFPSDPEVGRHFGGNVRFDHQGRMYVSLSDLTLIRHGQDTSTLNGTILRYNPDLSIPRDNPFEGSPIFAYGIRNTFGFDIAPDGTVYGADNGPFRHDEINRIVAGGNYGWPLVSGYCDHLPVVEVCEREFIDPVFEFDEIVGPTGAVVYDGDAMPELQGDLMVGGWHTAAIHRLQPVPGEERLERRGDLFRIPQTNTGEYVYDTSAEAHFELVGFVDVDVAPDGAILGLLSGAEVGSILRIAPEEMIFEPARVVETAETPGHGHLHSDSEDATCSTAPGPTEDTALGGLVLALAILGWRRRRMAWAGLLATVITLAASQASAFDVRPGARTGFGGTFVLGDNPRTVAPDVSYTAGGLLRLQMGDVFAMRPELHFQMKGSGIKESSRRLTLYYLSLPFHLEGVLPFDGWSLRAFAGMTGSLLVHASVGADTFTDDLNTVDYSVGGGLGVDVTLSTGTLIFDLSFDRGLRNLYAEELLPVDPPRPRMVNNTAYLTVGFLL